MAKKTEPEEARMVRTSVESPPVAEMPLGQYSNFMAIGHTGFDVFLDFSQIMPPTNDAELKSLTDPAHLVARPVVRIVIPRDLLPRIIEVLSIRQRIIESEGTAEQGSAE